jgi:hypothetical protein
LRGHRDLPWFTAIPTLTGAALVTVRIRLGTLVASPNFRHPLTLAEEIVTLDDISSGRVTLGIGQGSTGWDAAMLGAPPWSPRERSEPFREFVELTDMLLREPETNYVGSFYSVRDARTYPGCVQRPRVPVAIAAGAHEALVHGERGLDQRGVHPEHQLGVRGCIGSSGREATELHVDPPWTQACTACTRVGGPLCLLLRPVCDQVERSQRAPKPAPEVASIVGVLDDAGRDQWVGDLEECRGSAAQERRQR